MKKEEHKKQYNPLPIYQEGIPNGMIPTDPQGSYTGRPEEAGEVPVQDADDL